MTALMNRIVAGLLGVGGGMILVPVLFQTFIFFDLAAFTTIWRCQFHGDYLLHRFIVGA